MSFDLSHIKTKDNKCFLKNEGIGNPHALLMGVPVGTATMEISVAVPQRTKNR